MKKLIILLVAFLAISQVNAQSFNPTVTSNYVTVTTGIITPITIDQIATGNRDFGNLIQGQTRTFDNPNPIALFILHRQQDQGLLLTVDAPVVSDAKTGVNLITDCYRYTGNWTDVPGSSVEFAPGTQLQWDTDGGTQCNVAIVVTTASADNTAATGQHQFSVHMWAQYKSF